MSGRNMYVRLDGPSPNRRELVKKKSFLILPKSPRFESPYDTVLVENDGIQGNFVTHDNEGTVQDARFRYDGRGSFDDHNAFVVSPTVKQKRNRLLSLFRSMRNASSRSASHANHFN